MAPVSPRVFEFLEPVAFLSRHPWRNEGILNSMRQHVYIPWKSGDNARHDHIEIWTRRSPFLSVSRACLSTLVFFLGNVEGRWIPFLLFFKKVLDSLHFTLKVQDHIPRHQKHTATSSLRMRLLFFNFNFILQCFLYQKIILFFNVCVIVWISKISELH